MIRITPMREDTTVVRLRVEGRVTRQTVEELSGECEAAFADHHPLLLELSGVQFVDPAGIAVFRHLVRRGAVLTGCSGFLTELLRVNAAGEERTPEPTESDGYAQEAQLLERLRRGEDDAFEQLVRQHRGRLLATARRLLRGEQDAQDAVREGPTAQGAAGLAHVAGAEAYR